MQSLNPKLLIEDILTEICIIAVTVNSGNLGGEVAVQYKQIHTAQNNYIRQNGKYVRTVHTSGRYILLDGTIPLS